MTIFLFIMGMATIGLGVATIRILNEIVRLHITASDNIKMALYKCVMSLVLCSFSLGVACATVAWFYR